MEELSSCKLTLVEVNDVNEQMWKDLTEVSDKLGKDLTLSRKKMDVCTIMVAALPTFRSWQRPAAVANATLEE